MTPAEVKAAIRAIVPRQAQKDDTWEVVISFNGGEGNTRTHSCWSTPEAAVKAWDRCRPGSGWYTGIRLNGYLVQIEASDDYQKIELWQLGDDGMDLVARVPAP